MTSYQSLCVYTGSSINVDQVYKDAAQATGRLIAERGMRLVYGGGRVGLMGLCADAALDAGGAVIGIIPAHLQKWEVEHTRLTEMHVVDGMHNRKRLMVDKSDAFIVLPGGFGTLDETFEIMTWRQLHVHDKPIIIVNLNGYWDPLLNLIQHIIDSGFAHKTHTNLYRVVDKIADIFPALDQAGDPVIGPQFKWM